MPNVTLHGRVERERMPSLYQDALCLCCTSVLEGFPNTFLEAWSVGLPVVSSFDPDHLIAERGSAALRTMRRACCRPMRPSGIPPTPGGPRPRGLAGTSTRTTSPK